MIEEQKLLSFLILKEKSGGSPQKKWTIEHVKIFLNIARLTVPVDMYFCQEKKYLRNLQLENFPSEAPFSSNLYHLTSTQDQNQLLKDVFELYSAGASRFS